MCDVSDSRLELDLYTSENDSVISPFREGFILQNFASTKFRKNKTLAKISKFTIVTIVPKKV